MSMIIWSEEYDCEIVVPTIDDPKPDLDDDDWGDESES